MKIFSLLIMNIAVILLCCISTYTCLGDEPPCVLRSVSANTIIRLRVTGISASEWIQDTALLKRSIEMDLKVEEVLKQRPPSIEAGYRLSVTVSQHRGPTGRINDYITFWDQMEIEPDKSYILFSRMEGANIAVMMQSPMAWVRADEESALEDTKHILINADCSDDKRNKQLLIYLEHSKAWHGKFLGEYAGCLIAHDSSTNEDLEMIVKHVSDYRFTSQGFRELLWQLQDEIKDEARASVQIHNTKVTERLAHITLLLLTINDKESKGIHNLLELETLPLLLRSDVGQSAFRAFKIDNRQKSALRTRQNEKIINSDAQNNLRLLVELLEGYK
jgi:hypothetical protein